MAAPSETTPCLGNCTPRAKRKSLQYRECGRRRVRNRRMADRISELHFAQQCPQERRRGVINLLGAEIPVTTPDSVLHRILERHGAIGCALVWALSVSDHAEAKAVQPCTVNRR